MVKVTLVQADGSSAVVSVEPGQSLMRAAVLAGVPGIVAECGGQAMCATCHVYVREDHLDALPVMGDEEEEMLEVVASERRPGSRLSCQLVGLADDVVGDVPPSQI
ncbi:2Fe-2S iron-sulfur cluster-binding protein [Kineosporia sp. R_H_3]|uniref:2Fe-2S iron-sulfur cluster-binding protein n=1 Tax=Kineosporia sp. R_H_3 TaxID=1961848 RepID=UPI000B4A6F6D|nr:2Fe-2S iron-sulfur cluster-binding protein [Kineosporia sp. R_H_3]